MDKILRNKIIAHLRRIGYLNATYKEAMESAHKERGQWECHQCRSCFTRTELHGDHIDPVVDPATGFTDWNNYISRLFEGQIQPLCKSCHTAKSNAENATRRAVKSRR